MAEYSMTKHDNTCQIPKNDMRAMTQRHTHTPLFSYLQEAGKLDYTPSEAFGFWFDQTHLVDIHSEEPLGLAAIFTDHHTSY